MGGCTPTMSTAAASVPAASRSALAKKSTSGDGPSDLACRGSSSVPSTADEASSSSPLPAPVHRPPVSGYPVGAGFPAACELDDPELRPERPWLDHRRPLDTADPASQGASPDDRVDRPRPRPAQSREALGVGDVAPGAYTSS